MINIIVQCCCSINHLCKSKRRKLSIWQLKRRNLLIFLFLLLSIVACSSSDHTEFSEPFELSSFLKKYVQDLPRQIVKFQILNQDSEPIPYALLRFQWVEGGRMDFQSNRTGILSMRFEKDMLENKVLVSPKLERASERAKVRVTW